MSAPLLSLAYPRLWRPNTVPTFPVVLDTTHPLAQGLVCAFISTQGTRDLCGNSTALATLSGGVPVLVQTPSGPAWRQTTGADALYAPAPSKATTGQTFGVFWSGQVLGAEVGPYDSLAAGVDYNGASEASPYVSYGISCQTNMNARCVGGGANGATLTAGLDLTSAAMFGAFCGAYANGVPVSYGNGTNTSATIFTINSTLTVGGYRGDTSRSPNLATRCAYFFNQNFGATNGQAGLSQVAWLNAEPFAMFRPIVRRQYFVGTAGGTSFTATPGAGAVTLTGLQPAVSAAAALNPGVGSVAFTGLQPTVSIGSNFTAAPGVGAVAFAGMAPAVAADAAALPSVGSIIYTGAAPTVATSADVTALPGVGSIAFAGLAPTVTQSDINLTPGVGTVLLTGYQPTVTASPIIVPSVGGFDAGGFGKWYNTAFTTSSSSSERRARDSELGQMLDRLVYRDDVADIRADAEPEAAAEIVRAAVTEIKRSRYEINDEFEAIDRVKAQQTAYHALMRRRTEEESQRAFIAAVVEQSAHDQRKRHRIMRDDEDMMALFELAI